MSDVQQVLDHVRRLIDLDAAALDDEFYPAHLSVALIDAVFTTRLSYEKQVIPVINRYCRRFRVRRVRADRCSLPATEEQETLVDLIGHYDELGRSGMQEQVFRVRYCSPGTKILKSENVLNAALALRGIGIDTLQDAASKTPQEVKCVLRPLHGIGDRTIHMLLMYTGNDDFVKGDVHICRFVANALERGKVSAEEAERLVREAAEALYIAPRLLDYEIWKFGAMQISGKEKRICAGVR